MVEADGMNCFYSAEASSSSGMVATWGETLTVKSSSSSFSSSFFNRFDYENEDDDEDETGTLILSSDRVPDAFAMLGNAPGTWPDDSGATPDASKTCPDVSGTRPDVSGTCPDVSGTCPDASGTSPDAPPTVGSPPIFEENRHFVPKTRFFSPSRHTPAISESALRRPDIAARCPCQNIKRPSGTEAALLSRRWPENGFYQRLAKHRQQRVRETGWPSARTGNNL
jgi:hypothetical protein